MAIIKRFLIILLLLSLFLGCSSIRIISNTNNPCIPNDTSENVIIYVAHQDDEVFILPQIFKHLNSGDNIYVIYTCLSYQKGESYKNKRITESKRALESIGINNNNVYYLGFPDGLSYKYLNNIINTTDSIFNILSPQIVYTSAYEGGHIDHDIANYVISLLKTKYKYESFEFPEYSRYNTWLIFKMRSFPENPKTYIRELSKNEYHKVLNYWNYYKSQKFPFGLYMSITVGKKKTLGYLYLRKQPNYNYLKLPPTEKIAYECYLKAKFEDFERAIKQYQAANKKHSACHN